jgi:8-hydroxy-5-deazaflavin:NADPH oxidoreductase
MKIAIIGAGHVGGALGGGFARAGHEVTYGVRDPADPKHAGVAGERTRLAPIRDAVAAADAVVLATPWNAVRGALEAAGDLAGKPLLDATNPIGPGLTLVHGHTDSGAEHVARWANNAQVVKVFNTTGYENMANPAYGSARAVMFYAGDDAHACEVAATLARDAGFDAVHAGKLDAARVLEPLAILWIKLAMVQGQGRNIAFGLLRR